MSDAIAQTAVVVLPDPLVRLDLSAPILGAPLRHWQMLAFASAAPTFVRGVQALPDDTTVCSSGEPLAQPALLLFEGSLLSAAALSRLTDVDLADDESILAEDATGRPCAAQVGRLDVVPEFVPSGATRLVALSSFLSDSADSDHEVHAGVRVVDRSDLAYARDHVLWHHAQRDTSTLYGRAVIAPLVDWMTRYPRLFRSPWLVFAGLAVAALTMAVPRSGCTLLGTVLMLGLLVMAEAAADFRRVWQVAAGATSMPKRSHRLVDVTMVRSVVHGVMAVAVSAAYAQTVGLAAASAVMIMGAASALPPLLCAHGLWTPSTAARWELANDSIQRRLPPKWRDLPLPEVCLVAVALTDSAVLVGVALAFFAAWRVVGAGK